MKNYASTSRNFSEPYKKMTPTKLSITIVFFMTALIPLHASPLNLLNSILSSQDKSLALEADKKFRRYNAKIELPKNYIFQEGRNNEEPIVLARHVQDKIQVVYSAGYFGDLKECSAEAHYAMHRFNLRERYEQDVDSNPPIAKTYGELQGREFKYTLKIQSKQHRFVSWQVYHKAFFYNVTCLAEDAENIDERLSKEIESLVLGLKILNEPEQEKFIVPLTLPVFISPDARVIFDNKDQHWAWDSNSESNDNKKKSLNADFYLQRYSLVFYQAFQINLDGLKVDKAHLPYALLKVFYPKSHQNIPLHTALEPRPDGSFELRIRKDELVWGTEFTFVYSVVFNQHTALVSLTWSMKALWDSLNKNISSINENIKLNATAASNGTQLEKPERILAQADLINKMGVILFQENFFREALSCFERACVLDSQRADYISNRMRAIAKLPPENLDLAWFAEIPEKFLQHSEILSAQADLYKTRGDLKQALMGYQGLYVLEGAKMQELGNYVECLLEDQQFALAASVLLKAQQANFDLGTMLPYQIVLYHKIQRPHEASQLVEKMVKTYRYSSKVLEGLCLCLERFECFDTIEKAVSEMSGLGIKDGFMYYYRALVEAKKNDLVSAKASLIQAVKASPDVEIFRSSLDSVSAQLGEGNNYALSHSIEAVAVPQELKQHDLSKDEISKYIGDVGAYYEYFIKVSQFTPGQALKTTTSLKIVALDKRALNAFNVLNFSFNPNYERVFVNQIVVKDAQGKEVSKGHLADYFLSEDQSSQLHTTDKLINIPIKNLSVGGSVEATVTIERSFPNPQYPYQFEVFQSNFPMLTRSFMVMGATKNISVACSPNANLKRTNEQILFQQQKVSFGVWKNRAPPVKDFASYIEICETEENWGKVGQEYLASIQHRLKISPPVKKWVEDMNIKSEDPLTICSQVADAIKVQCNYLGIEFGIRARIPQPSEDFLSHRNGDCKDFSLLGYQVFNMLGLECHLVLAHTYQQINPNMPSLEPFNHVVLYLPKVNNGIFVDLTDRFLPIGESPIWLKDNGALVLQSDGQSRLLLQKLDKNFSRMKGERHIFQNAEGHFVVNEVMQLQGQAARTIRSYLFNHANLQPTECFVEYFDEGSELFKIEHVEVDHLNDLSKPLVVRICLIQKKYSPNFDSVVPHLFEHIFIHESGDRARDIPFRINSPMDIDITTIFDAAPKGYRWTTKASNRKFAFPFGQVEHRLEGDESKVKLRFTENDGIYPADIYDSFVCLKKQILHLAAWEFGLEKLK